MNKSGWPNLSLSPILSGTVRSTMFTGTYTAIVTPFTDGKVDELTLDFAAVFARENTVAIGQSALPYARVLAAVRPHSLAGAIQLSICPWPFVAVALSGGEDTLSAKPPRARAAFKMRAVGPVHADAVTCCAFFKTAGPRFNEPALL